jgi:hypothetical protein
MSNDLLILLVGAIIGFASALFLEIFKHFLEGKRLRDLEQQASKKNRYEDVIKFLHGDSPNAEKGIMPEPAWLRVVDSKHPNLVFKIIQQITHEGDINTDLEKPPKSPSFLNSLLHKKELIFRKNIRDKQFGSKFLIGPLNIIGRSKSCDIHISYDPSVSREHAIIRYEKNKFFLYDLGSANGTSLNGVMLEKRSGMPLAGGELISIGKTTFQFGLVNQVSITNQNQPSVPIENSNTIVDDIIMDSDATLSDTKPTLEINRTESFCPRHGPFDNSLGECPYPPPHGEYVF